MNQTSTSIMESPQIHLLADNIQSELDALRSLRRRSLSQPSAEIDPDLPSGGAEPSSLSPPASPTPLSRLVSPLSPFSLHDGRVKGGDIVATSDTNEASSKPDHDIPLTVSLTSRQPANPDLFWLPAHLHPEIAPQEFKAFLKEATKPENLLRRSNSALGRGADGLGRKKSMLSKVYNPKAGDGVGELPESPHRTELSSPVGRKASMTRGLEALESLTISDLQKLESLVAETSGEGAPEGFGERESKIRAVLRRSLTTGGLGMDSRVMEDPAEDDSPLVPRAPGHIIRRTARTKVRKPSLIGDGGGHRFPAVRRSKLSTRRSVDATHDQSEDQGQEVPSGRRASSQSITSIASESSAEDSPITTVSPTSSPPSALISDKKRPGPSVLTTHQAARASSGVSNSSLIDSYTYSTPESPTVNSTPNITSSTNLMPPIAIELDYASDTTIQEKDDTKRDLQLNDAYLGIPNHLLTPDSTRDRTPSPEPEIITIPSEFGQTVIASGRPVVAPPLLSAPSLTTRSSSVKEGKEKKSAWAKLGLADKKKEKTKAKDKVVDVVTEVPIVKKEKESFFGGLFGGSKFKKSGDLEGDHASGRGPSPQHSPSLESNHSPTPLNPTASAILLNGQYTNFYRLPIHVERAVYRLSHIKLANPRRPLYEQVLISNLMYWYLGVINNPVPNSSHHNQPSMQQGQATTGPQNARTVAQLHSNEASIDVPYGDDGINTMGAGGNGTVGRGRRDNKRPGGRSAAEVAIRSPQYDVQNRQLEEKEGQPRPQRRSQPLPVLLTGDSSPRRPGHDKTRRHSSSDGSPTEPTGHPPPGLLDEDDRPLRSGPPAHQTPIPLSTKRNPAGESFEVVTRPSRNQPQPPDFAHSSPSSMQRQTSLPVSGTERKQKQPGKLGSTESGWMASGSGSTSPNGHENQRNEYGYQTTTYRTEQYKRSSLEGESYDENDDDYDDAKEDVDPESPPLSNSTFVGGESNTPAQEKISQVPSTPSTRENRRRASDGKLNKSLPQPEEVVASEDNGYDKSRSTGLQSPSKSTHNHHGLDRLNA